jgi:hypothetical protein
MRTPVAVPTTIDSTHEKIGRAMKKRVMGGWGAGCTPGGRKTGQNRLRDTFSDWNIWMDVEEKEGFSLQIRGLCEHDAGVVVCHQVLVFAPFRPGLSTENGARWLSAANKQSTPTGSRGRGAARTSTQNLKIVALSSPVQKTGSPRFNCLAGLL